MSSPSPQIINIIYISMQIAATEILTSVKKQGKKHYRAGNTQDS
jgi:hypothetical protein